MSEIRVDTFKAEDGISAPSFPNGIQVTGVVTSTSLQTSVDFLDVGSNIKAGNSGILTVTELKATNVSVAGTLTYEDVTNVDSIGVITARDGLRVTGIATATAFHGDGSQLTGISVGIATEATTANGTTVVLDLSKDDHKVLATGEVTIDVTGGTEADNHVIRIENVGVATVGFATHFLFPSGAAPNLPSASGSFSLVSFTVHKVGAAGTILFAGASVNFS